MCQTFSLLSVNASWLSKTRKIAFCVVCTLEVNAYSFSIQGTELTDKAVSKRAGFDFSF